jgi:hypothetical protein
MQQGPEVVHQAIGPSNLTAFGSQPGLNDGPSCGKSALRDAAHSLSIDGDAIHPVHQSVVYLFLWTADL